MVQRAPLVPILCALAGCGEVVTEVASAPTADAERVRLLDGPVTGAAAVPPHDLLVSVDGDLLRLDPFAPLPEVLGAAGAVHGAVRYQDQVLVAAGDDLLTVGDFVGHSALGLPGPVTALAADDERLWLGTEAGLHLVRDGLLHEVTLDGQPIVGPFAPGSAAGLWIRVEQGLRAIALRDGAWGVQASYDGRVDSLAVDAGGTLYAAVDGDLVTWDGAFARFSLPSRVTRVTAGAEATGAFLTLDDGTWHVRDGAFTSLADDLPEGTAIVDGLGRLVVASAAGLDRITVGRRVLITGVREGDVVEVPRRLLVEATAPDDLASLVLTLDGTPYEARTIDPIDLSLDEHVLAAEASWTDGSTDAVSLTFFAVGLFDATWEADVEPLYTERCSACHDGATRTLLNTPELWETHFDDILDAVTTETMPLGSAPLTPVEIGVLKSWQAAGFTRQ